MPVEVTCAECGSTVTKRFPSYVRERNFCNHACLGKYRSKHYIGERAAHWQGGKRMDRGRVQIHRPDHPHAQYNGYVYRYRLVAEAILGRYLQPGEVVHHIDGDESNDHPDNLLVITQSEHARNFDARRRKKGASIQP